MHTLYGSKGSGSAAIEMALQFAGISFKTIEAASWEKTASSKELETLNPLNQIPVLVLPDGSILTESAAILIHLGLSYPLSGLLPVESSLRSQSIRGLVFIAANCYSAIGIIDYPERWIIETKGSLEESVRKGALQRLHKNWDIFADMFPNSDFLGGEMPNVLDFLAVVVSTWSGARAHLKDTRPGFHALLERVQMHEKVAAVYCRHWDG